MTESVARESGEAKLPGEDEYFENFVANSQAYTLHMKIIFFCVYSADITRTKHLFYCALSLCRWQTWKLYDDRAKYNGLPYSMARPSKSCRLVKRSYL